MLRSMVVPKRVWTLNWRRYWQKERFSSKGENEKVDEERGRERRGEREREKERERETVTVRGSEWVNEWVRVREERVKAPFFAGVWGSVLTVVRMKRNWRHYYQTWRYVEPLSSKWTRNHTEWFLWLRVRTTSTANSHWNEQDRYSVNVGQTCM